MNIKEKEILESGTSLLPLDKGVVVRAPADCNIYLWSDQHFGAVECNYSLAEKIVATIAKDKTAKLIMGGDTLEAIPRGYKISERGQTSTPDKQITTTARKLKIIKDKILVIFKGNHNTEARGESIDSDFLLAELLDCPYKTVPTVIQVITPKGRVLLAGGHGRSSARNGDIELGALRNIFPGCDVYFLGHNHMLYSKHTGSLYYDQQGEEHWRDHWFVRTGNCLNYAEYARFAVYEPQRSGCIRVVVKGGKVMDVQTLTSKDF